MCVTGETLILTSVGYQQAGDLVNEIILLNVDGNNYDPVGYGFSSSGNRDVYKVLIQNGSYLKASDNHKVLNSNGKWVRMDELKSGDILSLSDSYEASDGLVVGVEYVGCFYVYNCQIHGINKYVSEGGFYNQTQ